MSQTKKQDGGFDKIVDPETNKSVPIESAVGQQIVKNYLTMMNGGSEDELISTKKYYRSKSSSTTKSGGASKLGSINEKSNSKSSTPSDATSRGLCKKCGKDVLASHQRVKIDGAYYHEECFKAIKK